MEVKCNTCQEVKPIDLFFKDKSRKNGIRPKCKECYHKSRQVFSPKIKIEEAICSACKQTKPSEQFVRDKYKPTGIKSRCKECATQDTLRYYQKNREEVNERKRKRRENPEVKQKEKEFYKEYYHRPHIKRRYAEYRNRDDVKVRYETYRNDPENKERRREYEIERRPIINENNRNKYRYNKNFRITKILRNRIYDVLKGRPTSFLRILGCDLFFFKKWIEFRFDDQMSWDNLGTYWELDHILPVAQFDFLNDERSKHVCFHWTNYQPLPKQENSFKRAKIQLHYVCNNIVNVNRFNKKYTLFLGYQVLRETLVWLREKNSGMVTTPRI